MDKNLNTLNNRKIIVFGAGNKNEYIDFLLDQFGKQIAYFVDNDEARHFKNYRTPGYDTKIKIYPPTKLCEEKKDEIFVLISPFDQIYIEEIKKQLESMGLQEGKNYSEREGSLSWNSTWWNFLREHGETEPVVLSIELSSYCNLKCEFCNFHGFANLQKDREAFATWDIIKRVADQASEIKSLQKICCFHSGEELLNPEWFEMVQYVLKKTKIPNLTISTNGMLLDKQNILKLLQLDCKNITLIFSLGGNSIKECEEQRKNLDYSVVRKNILYAIEKLPKEKFSIEIHIDTIVGRKELENAGNVLDKVNYSIPDYAKEFERTRICVGPTVLYTSLPTGYTLPGRQIGIQEVRNSSNCCINLFNFICVDSEGYVLNCCCNGGYIRLGNIFQGNMLDIWLHSEIMMAARKKMKEEMKSPDFCRNCCYQLNGKFRVPVREE